MARIEISLEEYNALDARIKELENEVVTKEKIIEVNNTNIASLKEVVSFFINLAFFERIFKWNTILKAMDKSLYE